MAQQDVKRISGLDPRLWNMRISQERNGNPPFATLHDIGFP